MTGAGDGKASKKKAKAAPVLDFDEVDSGDSEDDDEEDDEDDSDIDMDGLISNVSKYSEDLLFFMSIGGFSPTPAVNTSDKIGLM